MAGLAALLGFLLGVFVGFGAQATSPDNADLEPEPRVTVTVEESEPPLPEGTAPAETPPQDTLPPPQGTLPPPQDTLPQPGQTTPPGQTAPPGQTQPTAPGQSTPPGTGTGPAINPASLRTLVVGRDIQPGTYRTAGPTSGFPLCYWARLRSTTGDVIATGMPTGPASVTIQATDKAFQTGGCTEWAKA